MNLKKERLRLRLTQDEFAKKLGIARQQYNRYENGANMSFATERKIEAALKVLKDGEG